MRNIDRIRQMDTKELAAFLDLFGKCHVCAFGECGDESCFHVQQVSEIPNCEEGIQKYLESEEEDNKQLELMEDESDRAVAEEAHGEYVKNGCKSRPISELWKELNL